MNIPATALDERLAGLLDALTSASGGQGLCRVDGNVARVKELEGRAAALLEVRRARRRDPGTDLQVLLDKWVSDRDSRSGRGANTAWQSYFAGAVAELEELVGAAEESGVRGLRQGQRRHAEDQDRESETEAAFRPTG